MSGKQVLQWDTLSYLNCTPVWAGDRSSWSSSVARAGDMSSWPERAAGSAVATGAKPGTLHSML